MFNLNPSIDQFELPARSFSPHLKGNSLLFFANFIENSQKVKKKFNEIDIFQKGQKREENDNRPLV